MIQETINPVTLLALGRDHLDRAEMFRAHGHDKSAALHFEVAERANDLAHAINEAEIAEPPLLAGDPIRFAHVTLDEAQMRVRGGAHVG